MGSGNSVFTEPWRTVNWREKQQMIQKLKDFQSRHGDDHLRIQVVGPAGAGKSSFITSVNTAIQGHNSYIAHSLSGRSSITCKFNPSKGLIVENNELNESQSKVHCNVLVIPADSTLNIDCLQKPDGLVIPKVVIMTKVDNVCPIVKNDLEMIYMSKIIKEIMEKCSKKMNFPMKYMFPVKNYYEEINNDAKTDVLLLTAVLNIVNFAYDLKDSGNPWRPMTWNERDKMVKNLEEFQANPGVDHLRILVVGPSGAGKSTFITSVNTALQGRSTYLAHSLSGGISVTSKYTVYKLNKGTDGSFFPFVFGDTMGLEPDTKGAQTNDIISILHGQMQKGYTFTSSDGLTAANTDTNRTPSLTDKVHCLVFVLAADTVTQITDEIIAKFKEILQEAHKIGIPIVVIISKVDETCQHVKEDLKMIYMSEKIKEKMEKCKHILGVPLNYIFPVKNYHEEINNNAVVDVLLLKAVTNILHFANDFVKTKG